MQNTQNYIQNNKEKFLNELMDLLRIPSISADPTYATSVHDAAQSVADHLTGEQFCCCNTSNRRHGTWNLKCCCYCCCYCRRCCLSSQHYTKLSKLRPAARDIDT